MTPVFIIISLFIVWIILIFGMSYKFIKDMKYEALKHRFRMAQYDECAICCKGAESGSLLIHKHAYTRVKTDRWPFSDINNTAWSVKSHRDSSCAERLIPIPLRELKTE